MDVVAVERRDESLVQQFDAIVGNLVGLFFEILDGVHAQFEVIEIGHQRNHFLGALHAQLGMLIEQIEKLAFGGHETSKHSLALSQLIIL